MQMVTKFKDLERVLHNEVAYIVMAYIVMAKDLERVLHNEVE